MVVECDYAYSLRRRASSVYCSHRPLADQCWYHGRIKRVHAQQLLKRDGDFLVRDSISKAGGFVLTGLWKGQPMHFEINQTPSSDPSYDMYHFEDEQFRSVVDLIEFYHNHRRRVTESSGFVLSTPVVNESKVGNGQLRELNNNEAEALQIEIEAAYAPYNGRPSENRFQRKLSQQALLNSARRHVPAGIYKSEQDLLKAALSTNEGLACVVDAYPATTVEGCADRAAADEDYCEVDYAAMDEVVHEMANITSSFAQFGLVPKAASPKRHSELMERRNAVKLPSTLPAQFGNSRSSHSLNRIHASSSQDSSLPPPSVAPAVADTYDFLDRAQSCSNLFSTTRWRRPSSSSASQISSSTGTSSSSGESACGGFRRYPSVKIEPAPLLPARSNTSLHAVEHTATKRSDKDPDYDHPKPSSSVAAVAEKTEEKDYDDPQRQPMLRQAPPRPAPKPTLAQLRAKGGMPKQLRNLATTLTTADVRQIALWITEGDCEAFQFSQNNQNAYPSASLSSLAQSVLAKLLDPQGVAFRKHLLTRSACVYVSTQLTIQKSAKPQEALTAWARIAQSLLQGVGNSFSFGSIMAAIECELKQNARLLMELDADTACLLRGQLLPHYATLQDPKPTANSATGYCFLPYVQPYLQLELSSQNEATSKLMATASAKSVDSLDVLWAFLQTSRRLLSSCESDAERTSHTLHDVKSSDNRFTTALLVQAILSVESNGPPRESQLNQVLQMYRTSVNSLNC